MRNKQHLVKEIVQLCAIKGSYKYFLASERSMFEVENATQVQQNLSVINRSLSDLYKELNEVASHRVESLKSVGGKDYQSTNINHQLNAVMLFNADRRFTLRE
jgi:hypothetical protein